MERSDVKSPIEYDRAVFEHGEIAITISTSRTNMPRVTIALGRIGREPGKPNAWIPWEWIDDTIEALLALRKSAHAQMAAEAASVREAAVTSQRQFQTVWTEETSGRRGRY